MKTFEVRRAVLCPRFAVLYRHQVTLRDFKGADQIVHPETATVTENVRYHFWLSIMTTELGFRRYQSNQSTHIVESSSRQDDCSGSISDDDSRPSSGENSRVAFFEKASSFSMDHPQVSAAGRDFIQQIYNSPVQSKGVPGLLSISVS